jgi:hypothetical protein
MTSVVLGIGIAALILAILALVAGGAALAYVVGMKNSTHQVVWKDVEPPKETEDDDPFIYDPPIDANPNKKIKTKPKEDDDLVDLDDPAVTSNDW